MALDYGYPELAKKSESYEICFVPDKPGDHESWPGKVAGGRLPRLLKPRALCRDIRRSEP